MNKKKLSADMLPVFVYVVGIHTYMYRKVAGTPCLHNVHFITIERMKVHYRKYRKKIQIACFRLNVKMLSK